MAIVRGLCSGWGGRHSLLVPPSLQLKTEVGGAFILWLEHPLADRPSPPLPGSPHCLRAKPSHLCPPTQRLLRSLSSRTRPKPPRLWRRRPRRLRRPPPRQPNGPLQRRWLRDPPRPESGSRGEVSVPELAGVRFRSRQEDPPSDSLHCVTVDLGDHAPPPYLLLFPDIHGAVLLLLQ